MGTHPADIQTQGTRYHRLKRNHPEKDEYGGNNFTNNRRKTSQRDLNDASLENSRPHWDDSFGREVGSAVHLCYRTYPWIDDFKCAGRCEFHLKSHSPHLANVRIVDGDRLSADQHADYPAKKTSIADEPNRVPMDFSRQQSMEGEHGKAGYQRNSDGSSASQMNVQQELQIWPRREVQACTYLVCDAGTQTYLTMAHLRPDWVPCSAPTIMCGAQRETDATRTSQPGSQGWQPSQSPSPSVPSRTVPSRVLREAGTQSDVCLLSDSCQPPAPERMERAALKGAVDLVSLRYSQHPVGGRAEPSFPCGDQLRSVGDEVNCVLQKRTVGGSGDHAAVRGIVPALGVLLCVLGALYLHQKRYQGKA